MYKHNSFIKMLKGVAFGGVQTAVHTQDLVANGKRVVSINSAVDNYKFENGFQDDPVELTNYLLIRLRENLLLYNKVNHPDLVLKSPTKSMYKSHYASQYATVHQDFHFQMQGLARIFKI